MVVAAQGRLQNCLPLTTKALTKSTKQPPKGIAYQLVSFENFSQNRLGPLPQYYIAMGYLQLLIKTAFMTSQTRYQCFQACFCHPPARCKKGKDTTAQNRFTKDSLEQFSYNKFEIHNVTMSVLLVASLLT